MTASNSSKDSKRMGPPLPYNSYNIFFILERTLLLESRENGAASATKMVRCRPSEKDGEAPCTGYECIDLPPLPPRFATLGPVLKPNWYDPGRKRFEKRKHTKAHGVASFREIAKIVATNWKVVDPITKAYAEVVATLLKIRHEELQSMGGMGCLTVGNRSSWSSSAASPPAPRVPKKPAAVSAHVPSLASSRVVSPTSGTSNGSHLNFNLKEAATVPQQRRSSCPTNFHEAGEYNITASFLRRASLPSSTQGYRMDPSVDMRFSSPDEICMNCNGEAFGKRYQEVDVSDLDSIMSFSSTDGHCMDTVVDMSFSLPDEICMNSNEEAFGKRYQEVDVSDLDIISFYDSI